MKRLLMLLLLLPFAYAQTDWFSSAVVKTELNVSSVIDLLPSGSLPSVDYVEASVIFIPQNTQFQAVRDFNSFPSAVVSGDRADFEWKSPKLGQLSYKYNALVEVANGAPRVAAKIPFPMRVQRGFEKYLASTPHIDSTDPEIIARAYKLAENEDDLFVVVSKVGFWVKNNVNYNLSTLTAEVSQSASWVLQNRVGVCDEITSLFIAMLRSLKIPARFVSGVAFTTSPSFPLGWGAHGWAEVYFPGVGWVPFDPTFGEFGWVDPGHIKLKDSADPQEPTTKFEWKARDVQVIVHDLNISALTVARQGSVPFDVHFTASALRTRVGFGSYNAIVADVENLADYYVAVELSLSRVTDMNIVDGETKQVVLRPRERQRVFWIVQVREDLDPKFQYEIPVNVHSVRNDTSKASFVAGQWDIVYSLADSQSSVEKLRVTQRDILEFACALESDQIFDGEGRVDCAVQNRGDESLAVSVCFESCQEVVVPAASSAPVSFAVSVPQPGPREIAITAKSDKLSKKAVLTLVRLDEPRLVIKDIVAPAEVAYGDTFFISFVLVRDSVAFPNNVSVEVKGGGAEVVLDLNDLIVDQDVKIQVDSSQLYSASPKFRISAEFQDKFGNVYAAEDSVSVRVNGVPWWKKVIGWFVDIF